MSNQAEQLSTQGWRPALKYLYDNDDVVDGVLKEINHFIEQLKKFNGPNELIAELEELVLDDE